MIPDVPGLTGTRAGADGEKSKPIYTIVQDVKLCLNT
jgi:hypothetical protein